jgi:hypothetical protein
MVERRIGAFLGLDAGEAVEVGELLAFFSDWLASDPSRLYTGTPMYLTPRSADRRDPQSAATHLGSLCCHRRVVPKFIGLPLCVRSAAFADHGFGLVPLLLQ